MDDGDFVPRDRKAAKGPLEDKGCLSSKATNRTLRPLCDQIYEISFDDWVRVPFRPEFLWPFFRYCLSSIAKLRDQVSH